MNGPVVVTGAGGNVGGAVVRSLLESGIPVRAAGTDPARLESTFPGVPAVRLDFTDPTTFAGAVDGAGGLFLVRPPAIARVGGTLNALLDVAAGRDVAHVVFSSVTGADTNRVVPHHRVEAHLKASTLSWTILRPGFFAQNLADAYRADITGSHSIVLPAGSGRVAFIDTRDIGDVAATVFAAPLAHRGGQYVLTGPRAVTFDEVASILTRELGRPITYRPTSALAYLTHVHRQGLPWVQALVQTVLHTGLRRGQAETVDPSTEHLLGHRAGTIEQYIHEHRDTWTTTTSAPAP